MPDRHPYLPSPSTIYHTDDHPAHPGGGTARSEAEALTPLSLARPAVPLLPALRPIRARPLMAPLVMPELIREALALGAVSYLSISGGGDSQALVNAILAAVQQGDWPGIPPLCAIHAHLGRAEWQETLPHCHRICNEHGLPLEIVHRDKGDLVQEIEERMYTLAGQDKPHWPSSEQRYCTSDQKRGPIDIVLRKPHWPDSARRYCTSHHKTNPIDKTLRNFDLVISIEGIRANESHDRQKKPVLSVRPSITTRRLKKLSAEDAFAVWGGEGRLALTWYPLLYWTKADVWRACGTSQEELYYRRQLYRAGHHHEALATWPCHPAYVYGMQRLSCALCVLAGREDLRIGARHNPALYHTYVRMEQISGYTFRKDLALASLFEGA